MSNSRLISAVKAYLGANPDGWLQNVPAAGTARQLTLPANNGSLALCTASLGATEQGFCSYLPSGFTSATPNAYGQAYRIQVIRNDTTALGTVPTSYSFLIATLGGDTIPDASGGRISAGIGNDGGFIYSNNVCNAQTGATTPNFGCGAYGTWATNVTAITDLAADNNGRPCRVAHFR